MFRSADAGASVDDLSALVTRRHASSRSPSTNLFSLCDRSLLLQARPASCLTESSGVRVSHTWALIFVPPSFVKERRTRQLGLGNTRTVASHW
jgi:hypothetical protein